MFVDLSSAHLCLVQPPGNIHALALLDPLRQFRHHLELLGIPVTVGKNRLVAGATNLIFGAHLGFDPAWAREISCVFVNLEQLGEAGAAVSPAYLQLLAGNPVIDYHPGNTSAYAVAEDVALVELGHLPGYDEGARELEDRPLDVLFFGSVTPRRARIIDEVRECGIEVSVLDRPLYGPERDELIRSAKAVLNLSAYETVRFEQVRAAVALSTGTPMISELKPWEYEVDHRFASMTHAFVPGSAAEWFGQVFATPHFFDASRRQLAAWKSTDTGASFEAAWARFGGPGRTSPRTSSPPRRVRLGVGPGEYRPGWINVGFEPAALPDVLLQTDETALPLQSGSRRWPGLVLGPDSADLVDLGAPDTRSEHITRLLALALGLLSDGGRLVLEWPLGTSVDVLDGFTDSFWRSGSVSHRFVLSRSDLVDDRGAPVTPDRATTIRLVLQKQAGDGYDMTIARAASDDLEFALGSSLP